MESQQVDHIIMLSASKFPLESMPLLRGKLLEADYSQAMMVISQMKDPTIALILSICLGVWGIDRLYIGSIGIGIAKMFTCGGAFIWSLIDCFMIQDATRQKNLEQFMLYM